MVTRVLSQLPGLTVRGFLGPEAIELDPLATWPYLASYGASPASTLDIARDESETRAWLVRQLELLGPGNVRYLSLGGHALAAWAVIDGGRDWLPDLWKRSGLHELIIVNRDADALCGFVEEEYHYECHFLRKGDFQWEDFTRRGDAR